MVAALSIKPAALTPGAGVLFTVSGAVSPTGQIIVYRNSDQKVKEASPEFGMDDVAGITSQKNTLSGTATGGTFTLTAVGLGYPALSTSVVTAPINVAGLTASILQRACNAAWGAGAVVVTGASLAAGFVITFSPPQEERAVTVTVQSSATGGTCAIVQNTAGGVAGTIPAGPYVWGPIFLPVLTGGDTWKVDVRFRSGPNNGTTAIGGAVTYS